MTERSSEDIARRLAHMDRPGLVEQLRSMHCTFDLDFTDEFLNSVSIERLRHIALAACLHCTTQSEKS